MQNSSIMRALVAMAAAPYLEPKEPPKMLAQLATVESLKGAGVRKTPRNSYRPKSARKHGR